MEKLGIEQRIQILEDKEAIKDITYQYACYVNQGWNGIEINPDALRNIFSIGWCPHQPNILFILKRHCYIST